MNRARGFRAEDRALEHLAGLGLACIARNFRCRFGEIDLVMQDGGCLVFVEVRYRQPNRFSSALLSVDAKKQSRIVRTATAFLGRHPQLADCSVRFDVVAIDDPDGGAGRLQWLRDAFRP